MYGFLEDMPFWATYLSLFLIVFSRTQLIYWAGRGIGAGLHRSRFAERLGAKLGAAERLINRVGPPAVTLSFMTVGIQTAVNITAGAMGMRFLRYTLALFAGSLIWALIYSVGGLAIIAAWLELFAHSPAAAAAVVTVVLVAAGAVIWWRIRRKSAGGERDPAAAEEQSPVF